MYQINLFTDPEPKSSNIPEPPTGLLALLGTFVSLIRRIFMAVRTR